MASVWRPNIGFTVGQRVGRGILYLMILAYLFVGIALVSDKFMESIELITSQVTITILLTTIYCDFTKKLDRFSK